VTLVWGGVMQKACECSLRRERGPFEGGFKGGKSGDGRLFVGGSR